MRELPRVEAVGVDQARTCARRDERRVLTVAKTNPADLALVLVVVVYDDIAVSAIVVVLVRAQGVGMGHHRDRERDGVRARGLSKELAQQRVWMLCEVSTV